MKKLLLKSMLLLSALIVGSGNSWADDFSTTYSYGGTNWTRTNFSDEGDYYKSSSENDCVASISGIFTGKNITSDVTITLNVACYGNGSDPTANKFKIYTSAACATQVTASQSGTLPTSKTYTNPKYTVTQANAASFSDDLAIKVASGTKLIRLKSITVEFSYTASSTPSSGVSFAYPSCSLDLKDASSFTQTATTADGYSSETGASVTYSMTANTAGATIDENTGEVTPTQAGSVTVQATAAAIAGRYSASSAMYTLTVTDSRVFTVTYHTGTTSNNEKRNSGATLSLDNPSDLYGMSFVGWSSTNNAANPTWVANTTKVTGDMVLFAMYQAVAGRYSYHLVETNQADWRGKYLVAYDNETFANGKTNGTSGIGSASTVKDPGDNLSGKIVAAAWGDEYYVTIEAVDDEDLTKGYLLKTQDDYYNYHTGNTSNGISGTTTNKSTASGHAITVNFVSSNEINLAVSDGPIFRYNTSSNYFRFYRTASYASQGKVYLYKRSEDAAPIYSLGITESITPGHAKITYVTSKIMNFANVSGLKAYVATAASGSGVTMTRVEAPVPANTPLLLIGTKDTEYNVPVVGAASAPATNYLVQGDGTTVFDGTTPDYILYSDGKFYQIGSGTVATNKAYLHLDSAPARALDIVFDDETTGIKENNRETIANNQFFDLSGRKVAQPTKGLYIVNGKKVVIK